MSDNAYLLAQRYLDLIFIFYFLFVTKCLYEAEKKGFCKIKKNMLISFAFVTPQTIKEQKQDREKAFKWQKNIY